MCSHQDLSFVYNDILGGHSSSQAHRAAADARDTALLRLINEQHPNELERLEPTPTCSEEAQEEKEETVRCALISSPERGCCARSFSSLRAEARRHFDTGEHALRPALATALGVPASQLEELHTFLTPNGLEANPLHSVFEFEKKEERKK